MAPPIDPQTRKRIAEMVRVLDKRHTKSIAIKYSVHVTTVRTIRREEMIKRARGDLNPARKPPGPPKLATPEVIAFIKAALDRDNTLFQDELAYMVSDIYGIELSQPVISRLLKHIRYTHKIGEDYAAQRNDELIADWNYKKRSWHGNRLVFLDETASCEKNGDRKWIWLERGLPGYIERPLRKAQRWSCLPGYTLDGGYIEPVLVEGGVTKELFFWWLEYRLLPALDIRPGYHDIVIMDNCAIYRNPEVIALIEAAGAQVHYLPLYCPFFNPIEQTFHVLKAFMRRFYCRKKDEFDSFEAFLNWAILEVGNAADAIEKAKGHFAYSGYRIDVADNLE